MTMEPSGDNGRSGTVGAVLLAAGRGKRMGAEINKVYVQLLDKPVLVYSLEKLLASSFVDEITLVIDPQDRPLLKEILAERFPSLQGLTVTHGGARRQDSSLAGVKSLDTDYVLVHDGARPNFSPDLLQRVVRGAMDYGAVLPGIRPIDTIRKVDRRGWVGEAQSRARLTRVQTPQGFRREWLARSLREVTQGDLDCPDDAGALMEVMGIRSRLVEGEEDNIKLTKPGDLDRLEVLMREG